MSQSTFSQAFEDGAPADIAAFSDGEGTYTTPAGVATSGIGYVIDYEPADEVEHEHGIDEISHADVNIATADVAAPVIGGSFTTADSLLWAIEMVQIRLGVATLSLMRTPVVERSAVGGHRTESET